MTITRDRVARIIKISMVDSISKTCEEYKDRLNAGSQKIRQIPLPVQGYIVKEEVLDDLPGFQGAYLNVSDIKIYMGLVGCFTWISSIRFDILFGLQYLSWYTQKPRQHHLNMADEV